MIKLSFILPCYNVEPFIGRCLDSLLDQDLPYDEYEIICVNDCSPDNMREVVLDYQKRYPIIRLIEHEVNKTAGGARNTGIEAAKGEYLWFVDPDDVVQKNSLLILLEKAKREQLDILFFNYQYDDKHKKITRLQTLLPEEAVSGESFVETFFKHNLTGVCTIWRSLYKKDFLNENSIRFPQIKASQDVVFAWKALASAQKVSSIDVNAYFYVLRQDSTTGSYGRNKAVPAFSRTVLFPYELLEIKKQVKSGIVANEIDNTIHWAVNEMLPSVVKLPKKDRKTFYNEIKDKGIQIEKIRVYMNKKNSLLVKLKNSPFLIWNSYVYLASLLRNE